MEAYNDYNIVDYDKLRLDDIYLNDSKFNKTDDIFESYVLYKDKPLLLKTSKMILNNMVYDDDELSSLIFEYPHSSNDFYEFSLNLEDTIKNKICDESQRIVGDNISKDNINDLYKSNIELPKTLTSTPELTIYIDDNEIHVCDKNNDTLDIDDIRVNNEHVMLLEVRKVIFHRRKIELILLLRTIKIFNQIPQLDEFMFENTDSDEDDEDINSY